MKRNDFTAEKLPALSRRAALILRKKLVREAFGPSGETVLSVLDALTDTGVTIKDVRGYIVFKNRFALAKMNLSDDSTVLGKRAQDLYPEKLWRNYVNREFPTMRTGKPIENKVFGFVADGSKAHNLVSVYALRNSRGRITGNINTFRRVAASASTPNWYHKIEGVIDHIANHYKEPITLARLADIAGCSRSRFCALFRKTAGVTPQKYLTRIRLNAARALLQDTQQNISDIAQDCGFYDHSHFIRTFRAITGQNPTDYRRQMRK